MSNGAPAAEMSSNGVVVQISGNESYAGRHWSSVTNVAVLVTSGPVKDSVPESVRIWTVTWLVWCHHGEICSANSQGMRRNR